MENSNMAKKGHRTECKRLRKDHLSKRHMAQQQDEPKFYFQNWRELQIDTAHKERFFLSFYLSLLELHKKL